MKSLQNLFTFFKYSLSCFCCCWFIDRALIFQQQSRMPYFQTISRIIYSQIDGTNRYTLDVQKSNGKQQQILCEASITCTCLWGNYARKRSIFDENIRQSSRNESNPKGAKSYLSMQFPFRKEIRYLNATFCTM